jgi:ornithine carbamoyltransferase
MAPGAAPLTSSDAFGPAAIPFAMQPDFRPDTTAASTALLAQASALKHVASSGAVAHPLLGKNLAVICAREGPDAELFRKAGIALGARVTFLRPTLGDSSSPAEIEQTARVLGRLYDGVECQGLEPRLVQQMRAAADVPIFDAVASSGHPSAHLDAQLGGTDLQANRLFIVQAILMETIL